MRITIKITIKKTILFIIILRLFSIAISFLIFFKSFVFSFRHIVVSVFSIFSLFIFFLLQISFCIYLLLAALIFLYHFHSNLLLYLVSRLCFFDKLNQRNCIHSFLYMIKKTYETPILSTKLEWFIISAHLLNCIISAHIPKMNSVKTSFNISNSNIIKTRSFLH